MTQKNNQTQEKTEQPRFGDVNSSIAAYALSSAAALVSAVLSPAFFSPVLQFAFWFAPIGFMAGLLYQCKKRVTASVGIAVASVFGVAGLAVGAATGHFVDMKNEIDSIPVAAANAQKYKDVPVVESAPLQAFSAASLICKDMKVKPLPFPNGETRKVLAGADGKRVAVICQLPRMKQGL